MVGIAEVNREQVNADQQSKLVECYFGLRLGQRVVAVKEATYNSLKTHYDQALKLEQNGMINRAERLFAQVSMDEAKRELDSARKDLEVAGQALKSLIDLDADKVDQHDNLPFSSMRIFLRPIISKNWYRSTTIW